MISVLRTFPVYDLHCDTAVELFLQQKTLRENELQIDLLRAEQLKYYVQYFAFCCVCDREGKQRPQKEAERLFLDSLANFEAELDRNDDLIRRRSCMFDLIRQESNRKMSAILSLEGPEVIDCDPGRLEWLYEKGFRMTTLTWNFANKLAGSCWTGEGLSDQGREFVREAQRLGIAIDVSHLSERAFWDIVDITTKPIVASHSDSRVCCDCPRNLTDDQFRAIRDLHGVVGLNLYAPFLNESGKATFDDVCRHLDHWLSLDGQHTVALGGDLDGCDVLPEGFSGVEDYNRLGNALLRRGYSEELLSFLFSGNASRLFVHLCDPLIL